MRLGTFGRVGRTIVRTRSGGDRFYIRCTVREEVGRKTCRIHEIGVHDYQNFLKNWDEARYPVLYAVVRTPGEYNALFHPAHDAQQSPISS